MNYDFFNGSPEDGEPVADCKDIPRLIERLRDPTRVIRQDEIEAADALEAKDRHIKELSELIDLNSKHDAKNVERIAELETLLVRYMANVIDHEGVAFLNSTNYTFTLGPAERALLLGFEKKARRLLNE